MVNIMGPRTDSCGTPHSTHAAQMLISWSELFECDRLDTIGTSPKHSLWYQMMIPVNEVSADGQSCQMQHWDRIEWVLLPHECRLPAGGHSEHVVDLSQCCPVDDMLIERLHTDGELSDDQQAAHIQCVLQVWVREKGSKQAENSLKFHNQIWPFLGLVKQRLSSILHCDRCFVILPELKRLFWRHTWSSYRALLAIIGRLWNGLALVESSRLSSNIHQHYNMEKPCSDKGIGQQWTELWPVAPNHYLNQMYWLLTSIRCNFVENTRYTIQNHFP